MGCARLGESDHKPPEAPPKALAVAASSDDACDLRIISLDLDPPPNGDGSFSGFEKRTLLAAVDNQGKTTENNVIVTLEIRGPADTEPLVSQTQTIPSLAPGEVKVLKFTGFTSLPARPSYSVLVDLKPAIGERNVADNHKSLELQAIKP